MTPKTETKSILSATVKERAIIYARVSNDDTKNATSSIEAQIRLGREYAERNGYLIVAEMHEDDKKHTSGADFDLPELNKIKRLAKDGEFDVLIVKCLDRLARNLEKQMTTERLLNEYGVRIEYVQNKFDDSPAGIFSKTVYGAVAELERSLIRERMLRGKNDRVAGGSVMVLRTPPYGYRAVSNDRKVMLELEPDEAEIVRLIYQWFTIGDGTSGPMAIKAIADKLTGLGIQTAGDKGNVVKKKIRANGVWYKSTVWKILSNETYAGVWKYGKTRTVKGKPVKNDNPIPVIVPAIVTRVTWDLAQARLNHNKAYQKRNSTHEYLFSGRCTCGHCNSKMAGRAQKPKDVEYLYYWCEAASGTGARASGATCDIKFFRADMVEFYVMGFLHDFVKDENKLRESLDAYRAQQDDTASPLKDELRLVNEMIGEQTTKLIEYQEDINRLPVGSRRTRDTFLEKIATIEELLDRLETRRNELTATLQQVDISDQDVADLLAFTNQVADDWEEIVSDFEAKRQLLEVLDIQIRLKIEDGEKYIYLKGRFIPEFCVTEYTQTKPNGPGIPMSPRFRGWWPTTCGKAGPN